MHRLITAILAIGALSAVSGAMAAAPSAGRPNVLFIMADDLGQQAMSCYGSPYIKTPGLDRIAAAGMRFTAAYANNSICSPSRAVLLTGKYNHLCGVKRLDGRFDGSQPTFPKLLQAAGYQTAIVGKWHLASQPTGYDYYAVMTDHGRYHDCPLTESGAPWGNRGERGAVVHKGYLTDVITDVSLQWLERRDTNRPFCLMIHHKAPHAPYDAAPRHKDLFADTVFPEPPTLLDDYAGRAPEAVAGAIPWSRLLSNDFPEFRHLRRQFTGDRAHDTRLVYQAYLRGYLRLVAALDENVGRVLDHLEKTGLATNTVVIFTSDNGYFLGEHGFYNKMWMYEEGFRLPLLVRMPGVRPGSVNGNLVGMFDIAPTILNLAGVPVPDDMQGRSFRPLLTGQEAGWREAFYYHYYGIEGNPGPGNWIAGHEIAGVRTDREKFVFYPTWKGGPFFEYFDLAADPHEMRNRYSDPECHAAVRRMERLLRDEAQRFHDEEVIGRLEAAARQK